MSFIQKISFKASNSNLLQKKYVSKAFLEKNKSEKEPVVLIDPHVHQRPIRKPSALSYVNSGVAAATVIVSVIALRKGKSINEDSFLAHSRLQVQDDISQ